MNIAAIAVLGLSDVVGLLMVPLGLPGLWVMVGGFLLFGWMTEFHSAQVWMIATVIVLAFAGEVLENWLGFRFARRYGGSRRSGWGALIGGLVGAGMGVPVPVIGSVIGAFVGAFVGAVLFEYWATQRAELAISVGWGAVLGRAAGAAAKIALGVVIGVVGLIAVFGA
jgi:uncharacterized protein YqgC (DUF456 family)